MAYVISPLEIVVSPPEFGLFTPKGESPYIYFIKFVSVKNFRKISMKKVKLLIVALALMIGVGAGFDYHAGNIKRAPEWMQKSNLEWVYRLMQDPKRLFKRYFISVWSCWLSIVLV